MPGNPRAIVAEAERRLPVRIAVKIPNGIPQYQQISDWLDENCGLRDWAITPIGGGRFPLGEDAVAVYVGTPACAVAFTARWLITGERPGFFTLRYDGPPRRVPMKPH